MSPQTLRSKFISKIKEIININIDGTIPAYYANFGYIPYGH
jgi:hypothetical protein